MRDYHHIMALPFTSLQDCFSWLADPVLFNRMYQRAVAEFDFYLRNQEAIKQGGIALESIDIFPLNDGCCKLEIRLICYCVD